MRKLMMTALMAAVAMPVFAAPSVANAQSRGEIRRDRQDVREERRELRQAVRTGNQRQIQRERRDVRDARQELREDRRDANRRWGANDWRPNRDRNRGLYARGNWRAPFRYNSFRAGVRIAPAYFGSRYVLNDPWRYRLPPVGRYQRYVRHYNDLLLVDARRGQVVRVIRNFYW